MKDAAGTLRREIPDANAVIAINGRAVLVAARFSASKGVLKAKGVTELINQRPARSTW